jgi:hypothetical protein
LDPERSYPLANAPPQRAADVFDRNARFHVSPPRHNAKYNRPLKS